MLASDRTRSWHCWAKAEWTKSIARDTKLKRDVALKILPDAFAQDRERMARFEREAQLLAALNHPNIAAIYGLEESNGVRALVMELVEGPTLAERFQYVGRALSGPPVKPVGRAVSGPPVKPVGRAVSGPPAKPDPIGSGLLLEETSKGACTAISSRPATDWTRRFRHEGEFRRRTRSDHQHDECA